MDIKCWICFGKLRFQTTLCPVSVRTEVSGAEPVAVLREVLKSVTFWRREKIKHYLEEKKINPLH